MNAMTKTPVCVTGNTTLFNNIIEEIALLVADVSTIHLPNPEQVENGFDEDVLTHFGNTIRSLEGAYNGLIIFARCKAFGITPVANGMPATDNDTQPEV